jgi:hypothetical protein
MCRSTNGRASLAEPEIWFRIVHVAVPARACAGHARAGGDGTNAAPVAAPACAAEHRDAAGRYREQTVEIALGPLPAPRHAVASRQAGKGAFENGNVGRLTCLRRGFGRQASRVPADQVISAVSPPRGKPKLPKEPRTPRVVELPCPRRTK